MSEQLLDDPQIGTTLEQVGREGMAQRVGADLAIQTGARRRTVDGGPRLLPGEAASAVGGVTVPALSSGAEAESEKAIGEETVAGAASRGPVCRAPV